MADRQYSDSERQKYVKDPRIACKYGTKCYQKNPIHQQKYKHPPPKKMLFDKITQPKKKFKMDFTTADKPEVKTSTASSEDEKIRSDDNNQQVINTDSSQPKQQKNNEETKIDEVAQDDNNQQVIDTDSSQPKQQKNNEETKIDEVAQDDNNQPVIDTDSSHPKQQKNNEGTKIEEVAQDKNSEVSILGRIPINFDPKDFINEKFLVEMPEDFYTFWDFCKKLNEKCPQEVFKNIGLTLVGPYDVLAGKFYDIPDQPNEKYLTHWRYFYDPPEFQTVLKGDHKTEFHIGYFRDSPKEMPVYLASNCAKSDGCFKIMGDNIFAAVYLYLEDLKKTIDPFKKMHIGKFQSCIRKRAEELNLSLSEKTQNIRNRDKKIVTRSFSKMGIVVPYNRKSQLGYRDLGMTNKQLVKLLDNIQKALPEQKQEFLSDLQNLLTNVNIATDECDFGTGIELGLDILAHGVDSLNHTVSRCLATNHRLIGRDEFAKIAEAHMKNRKKGVDLSII